MRNKKLKLILSSLIVTGIIISNLAINSNANTVIPVKEVNGKKYVSLTELTNATGGTVVDNADIGVKTFSINGKVVTTNNKMPFVSVDNDILPYETKEVGGLKVPNFQVELEKSDSGEVLFPVNILAEYVGMNPTDEGFVIESKTEDKKEEEKTENTSQNSSNGSVSSNTGSSNGGSANNGSTEKPKAPETPKVVETPKPVETPTPTPTPQPEPKPTPEPTPVPSEPSGLTGAQLNAVAESYGWTREGGKFNYYDHGMRIGGILISGNSIDIVASGYSPNFASTLRQTLSAVIPNGVDKAMSMIESGSAGSFTANNRSVNISSGGYIEIR